MPPRSTRIASERLQLDVDILRDTDLPPPGPKPFFSILDETLSDELRRQIDRPYLDGHGRPLELRRDPRQARRQRRHARARPQRSQAYASNSHIFLVWMGGSSLVLLGIAILFLRNQIRPILRLAEAAEAFGKGREIEFRPRGAREVRQAGHAFLEMKRRIERNIEQRTTMLNGVSHDLRTILTRFKLSLALLDQTPEVEDLEARRRRDEPHARRLSRLRRAAMPASRRCPTDLRPLLEELQSDAERQGHATELDIVGDPMITVRPDAFRRLLFNLVANAARHGDGSRSWPITRRAGSSCTWTMTGRAFPPTMREEVFKPFFRLDEARNQDEGGSGLGLAIARDIARAHGGDITLGEHRWAACARPCGCRPERHWPISVRSRALLAGPRIGPSLDESPSVREPRGRRCSNAAPGRYSASFRFPPRRSGSRS